MSDRIHESAEREHALRTENRRLRVEAERIRTDWTRRASVEFARGYFTGWSDKKAGRPYGATPPAHLVRILWRTLFLRRSC